MRLRAPDGARRLIYLGRKGLWSLVPATPPEPPKDAKPQAEGTREQ